MIASTALFVAKSRCGKNRVGCRDEALVAPMQATPFGSRMKPRTASLSGKLLVATRLLAFNLMSA